MKLAAIKSKLPAVISYLFILLFVYAAVSKVLDFQNFQAQLGQSPLISAYAGIISYGVLALEFLISVLLAVPRFRIIALYGAFSLMVMFTAYIAIILSYSTNIPCSCGGILEKMGWKEHLVFNGITTLLAASAVVISPANICPDIRNSPIK